jgi:hypothetical protein
MLPRIIVALPLLACGLSNSHDSPPADRAPKGVKRHVLKRDAVTNLCQATYLSCTVPGYYPVGTPCWCTTPTGPVVGHTTDLPSSSATEAPPTASKP